VFVLSAVWIALNELGASLAPGCIGEIPLPPTITRFCSHSAFGAIEVTRDLTDR